MTDTDLMALAALIGLLLLLAGLRRTTRKRPARKPQRPRRPALILDAARHLDARVVTNDRYRDWAGDYPEVTKSGFLIRGGFGKKGLWLNEKALAAKP